MKDFTQEVKKKGVTVTEAQNKKGNTYGLCFEGYEQTFKASQIGKEFGYRTLLNTFSANRHSEYQSTHQNRSKHEGAYLVGKILSGLGGMITPSNYTNDYEPTVADQEERISKLKNKRRYGRQQ